MSLWDKLQQPLKPFSCRLTISVEICAVPLKHESTFWGIPKGALLGCPGGGSVVHVLWGWIVPSVSYLWGNFGGDAEDFTVSLDDIKGTSGESKWAGVKNAACLAARYFSSYGAFLIWNPEQVGIWCPPRPSCASDRNSTYLDAAIKRSVSIIFSVNPHFSLSLPGRRSPLLRHLVFKSARSIGNNRVW